MKTFLKAVGLTAIILGVLITVVIFNSSAQRFVIQQLGPNHSFTEDHASPAPDYTQRSNWLAHPDLADNSDWAPEGLKAAPPKDARAYVFFIHPTAYLRNDHWFGSIDKSTATDENKQWMMANLASAYNGCCHVYAPYFREATIHAFLQEDLDDAAKALDFAYQDVARAFEHFIRAIPAGSPYIVASHSQGTVHGQRLLQQQVDGTPLAKRLVAAFLIGCTVHADLFDHDYQDIQACENADDLGCVNAYDTWVKDGGPNGASCPNWSGEQYVRNDKQWLCVNPLSWQADDKLIQASANPGSVPVQNPYNISIVGEDKADGLTWSALQTPIKGQASAQCVNGILRTNDQTESVFKDYAVNGNYHGLDYALFYSSIRDNAKQRVEVWWNNETRTP